MTSNLARLRGRLALIVAVAVVIIVSLSVTMLSTAGATTHRKRHHHHSCIPQHNGGDRDSDNRGGPSDGDGCL